MRGQCCCHVANARPVLLCSLITEQWLEMWQIRGQCCCLVANARPVLLCFLIMEQWLDNGPFKFTTRATLSGKYCLDTPPLLQHLGHISWEIERKLKDLKRLSQLRFLFLWIPSFWDLGPSVWCKNYFSAGASSPPHLLEVASHSATWLKFTWNPPAISHPEDRIIYRLEQSLFYILKFWKLVMNE